MRDATSPPLSYTIPNPTHGSWTPERPHVLIIACSDGRLQESLDEFLGKELGITRYDRLYAPGGPGALATHGCEFLRADQYRRECTFLIEAHQIEDVFLILHGPAPDGPAEAVCADYRRVYPRLSPDEIRAQQERDVAELLSASFGGFRRVQTHVYRCEVNADHSVRYVPVSASRG